MALSARQKLTIALLTVYWPTLCVLAHLPVPDWVRQAGVSDKVLHFLAYLILVFLLWFSVRPEARVNWRRATVCWVFAVVALYAVADELTQSLVGRSCDIRDFGADLVGIITGLVVFTLMSFWPAVLLVTAVAVFGLTNLARTSLAEIEPIANFAFHLLAYGFFTLLWIRNINRPLSTREHRMKWLFTASALPVGLLFVVKLASFLLGRRFPLLDVFVSVGAIASVVAAFALGGLLRGRAGNSRPSSAED